MTPVVAGAVNVAPVRAGDVLILSEATVHGILPWMPTDRLRRFLVLRYGVQYSGTQPLLKLPSQVAAQLSDQRGSSWRTRTLRIRKAWRWNTELKVQGQGCDAQGRSHLWQRTFH